jgi:hypothetical protein
MRQSHQPAPLHRIETWNGCFFRPAALWEVGTYILVPHHDKEALCRTLQFQKDFLSSQQIRKDDEEQTRLRGKNNLSDSESGPDVTSGTHEAEDFEMTEEDGTWDDDVDADAAFESSLNDILNDSSILNPMEEDFDSDAAETDIPNVVEYIGPYKQSSLQVPDLLLRPEENPGPAPSSHTAPSSHPAPDCSPEPCPDADGLNNAYVRVLHTNGIHHIAMVTCCCNGPDKVPIDLVSCRLLPASFIRIRTIFTSQLMDYFRLCNLELKASAYQFYMLIGRLTSPRGHSEIVNLYHEFRRMSRLWRWMKKLKWAGYGHNQQDHRKPPAGSLAIFCPTCPQPALNLPNDWKLDPNR